MAVQSLIYIFSFAAGLLALRLAFRKRHRYPLPPGPKGFPLVGNINDLPKEGAPEWKHWLEFKDRYGDLSSITVLGQTFIIIHDAKIAVELLQNRSALYSARPHMHFSSEMCGWKRALAFSPDTDTFKQHRKNIAKIAGTNASRELFERVQEEETVHFLSKVVQSPEKLFDHIKQEAAAVILKTTYGYTIDAHGQDPLADLAGKTMEEFGEAAMPGKWAVDILPLLEYIPDFFPGATFKQTARTMSSNLYQTAEQPYQFVKQQMRNSTHKTSFLSQAIQDLGPEMEPINKWSAASMYLGGADTTVSSIMTFFLAMMLYPDVQKKAQEELDRVVGDRLPLTKDLKELPYIEALVKEVHRWHPVGPLAIPHAAVEEDVFEGYRIPKGALILPNNWWFTHDPKVYADPMEFKPERYLSATPDPDPRTWTFGYGRRICPGRRIADIALIVTIAQSLSVLSISKPVENGKVVEPEVEFSAGVVSHPKPYRADIKLRSERHKQMLEDAERKWPFQKSDKEELLEVEWS